MTRMALLTCSFLLFSHLALVADPVEVRRAEGVLRGFLVLRTLDGERMADGDLIQVPSGGRVTDALDLSVQGRMIHEESAVYTQHLRFRLLSARLVQKGPTFPRALDMSVDAAKNRVTVHYVEEDGKEKTEDEKLELPGDLRQRPDSDAGEESQLRRRACDGVPGRGDAEAPSREARDLFRRSRALFYRWHIARGRALRRQGGHRRYRRPSGAAPGQAAAGLARVGARWRGARVCESGIAPLSWRAPVAHRAGEPRVAAARQIYAKVNSRRAGPPARGSHCSTRLRPAAFAR